MQGLSPPHPFQAATPTCAQPAWLRSPLRLDASGQHRRAPVIQPALAPAHVEPGEARWNRLAGVHRHDRGTAGSSACHSLSRQQRTCSRRRSPCRCQRIGGKGAAAQPSAQRWVCPAASAQAAVALLAAASRGTGGAGWTRAAAVPAAAVSRCRWRGQRRPARGLMPAAQLRHADVAVHRRGCFPSLR